MKRKLLPILFLLLTAFVVLYLAYKKDKELFYCPEIVDYIHKDKINPLFEKADNYKYHQDFFSAITAFETILNQNDISNDAQQYAINQITFCCLSTNQDSLAEVWIKRLEVESDTVSFKDYNKADYFYNKGVSGYRAATDDANVWFDKALSNYQKVYPQNHLKLAWTYTQLAMWQYEYGMSFFVVKNYLNAASKIFNNNDKLQVYRAENILAQATYLRYERADHNIDETCESMKNIVRKNKYYFNSVLYARALIIQNFAYRLFGNRKYKDDEKMSQLYFQKATDTINKAIAILEKQRHLRVQEAYHNKALVFQNRAQITKNKNQFDQEFFKTIAKLEEVINTQKDRKFSHPNLLKAFYFSQTKPDSSIKLKCLFSAIEDAKSCKWNHANVTDMIFYTLQGHYKEKKDFKSALFYNAQNLCALANQKYNFQILYSDIIKYGDFYQSIGYKQRADIFFASYEHSKNENDLKMAQYCYDLADTLLYANSLNYELDVVLNLQNEVGNTMYSNAIEVNRLIYIKSKDHSALDKAFKYMDRMKSYFLYKNMVVTQNPEEEFILNQLKQLNNQQEQMRANNYSPEKINSVKEQIKKNYAILKDNYPNLYSNFVIQNIPSIKSIQQSFSTNNEAIIEFKKTGDALYSMLISKNNVIFHRQTWSKSHDSLLTRYCEMQRENIKNKKDDENFRFDSFKLYKLLLSSYEYLWASKNNKIHQICIIPDKELNSISFDALLTDKIKNNEEIPYLLNDLAISYSPSWKVWNTNKNYKLNEIPSVAFFTYKSKSESNALALISSDLERNAIQKFSKSVQEFNTKESLVLNTSTFDIVHLSLHALCNTEKLDSNIIYFGIKNQKLCEPVFTYDILKMNRKSGLLVLTACETARGNNKYSEGVFSLSRSFLQVGFSNIISTYWKVNDETTGEIMTYFYYYLSEKKNVTLALREAKITFLKRNRLKFSPYLWAGLVLMR
jgi:CHAT domain-containing protein